jgi:hypothetical protein
MNSHEFRTVVRDLDSATIKKYNVKPAYFKAVCFALSMYGDYKSGTRVKPSWLTVAKNACVDRKTAMKVRDILLSSGILVPVSKTEANISVYEFSDNYTFDQIEEIPEGIDWNWTAESQDELSILAEQLSNSEDQLSITKDQLSSIDGHNTTIDTTYNSNKDITITEVNIFKSGRKDSSGWKHLNLLEI